MHSFNGFGYIGRDGELRTTQGGQKVLSFSVGIDNGYKKDDKWVDRTLWVKIVVFGNYAETVAKKAKKGAGVVFDGSLRVNPWKDDKGEAQAEIEINVTGGKLVFTDKVAKNGEASSKIEDGEAGGDRIALPW